MVRKNLKMLNYFTTAEPLNKNNILNLFETVANVTQLFVVDILSLLLPFFLFQFLTLKIRHLLVFQKKLIFF